MDRFDLTGKVAVVTGGNGGIGLGMARGLARAGASIAVVGRDAGKSARAVSEIEAIGVAAVAIEADLTESEDHSRMAETAAERLGAIDVLVNNAGTNIRKRPEDLDESEWRTVMDTNLTSAFLASKACYPYMKRAGAGRSSTTDRCSRSSGRRGRRPTPHPRGAWCSSPGSSRPRGPTTASR